MKTIFFVLILIPTLGAHAADEDALLRIESDLVLHPAQTGEILTEEVARVREAPSWKWGSLKFAKPYRTSWTGVEAFGPWDVRVDTSLAEEITLVLRWPNPILKAGHFEIHDSVSRSVGGVPINFNLEGSCTGVEIQMPGAEWQVTARLRWDSQLTPHLSAFEMVGAPGIAPLVNLGECRGPSVIFETVRELVGRSAADRVWLENLVKGAVIELAKGAADDLRRKLLAREEFNLFDPLVGAWIPSAVTAVDGGSLRVAGEFVFSVPGSELGADLVERSFDPLSLSEVKESGFVLPRSAVERFLRFLHVNGLLQYRLSSADISAFQSLMWNRLMQFFVWPDLMSFARDSRFYFYFRTDASPRLSDGVSLDGGGVAFGVSVPLTVQQWAPVSSVGYVPYLNFETNVEGSLFARVVNERLQMRLKPYGLNLSCRFAPEFMRYRGVNTRLSCGLIGNSARSHLSEKIFEFPLPAGVRDLQIWPDSLRLPLTLRGR